MPPAQSPNNTPHYTFNPLQYKYHPFTGELINQTNVTHGLPQIDESNHSYGPPRDELFSDDDANDETSLDIANSFAQGKSRQKKKKRRKNNDISMVSFNLPGGHPANDDVSIISAASEASVTVKLRTTSFYVMLGLRVSKHRLSKRLIASKVSEGFLNMATELAIQKLTICEEYLDFVINKFSHSNLWWHSCVKK